MSGARELFVLALGGGLRPARWFFAWLPLLVLWLERPTLLVAEARIDDLRRGSLAWIVLATVLAPAALDAAGMLRRAAQGRSGRGAGWLISSGANAWLLTLTWFAGRWCAVLLLALVPLVALELVSDTGAPAWREAQQLEHEAILLDSRTEAALPLELTGSGRLSFECLALPGAGPAATLHVETAGGKSASRATARVAGRRSVSVEASRDARVLRLQREEPGAWLLVPRNSLQRLEPASTHAAKSVALGVRLALLAGIWIALGAALGSILRPALVLGLLVGAWLVPWCLGPGAASWPAGDLFVSLASITRGSVPPAPATSVLLTGLLASAGSLAFVVRRISTRSSA